MQFQLVCFDLDGTLVDSHDDIRAALEVALDAMPPVAAGEIARDYDAVGAAGLGLPLDRFLELARPGQAADAALRARFVDAYRGYYHAHLLDRTRPFPGVVETLERIRPLRARGLRTAVATTKKTDTARRVIAGLGLEAYFDTVLGTDGIPHKPAPDLLHLAARTVERASSGGLMIGDTLNDVLAGKAAGMKTCGVGWGVGGAEGLQPHAPDWLVSTFPEIYDLIA